MTFTRRQAGAIVKRVRRSLPFTTPFIDGNLSLEGVGRVVAGLAAQDVCPDFAAQCVHHVLSDRTNTDQSTTNSLLPLVHPGFVFIVAFINLFSFINYCSGLRRTFQCLFRRIL